jgi:signal transduction histidine kinase/ligand-binding sensor domain-containing protein
VALILTGFGVSASAATLWSDLGATLVHETQQGQDLLGGLVKRDDKSSDTLYFKFHIDPLSDASTEEYFAGFQLYEGTDERLGVGNSLKAWAYSAYNTAEAGEFNKVFGDMDLKSSRPESSSPGVFLPYELPRRGIENTVVFKVQYVSNGLDQVTVWLNPDLGPGATESGQRADLTTKFTANASFDQIRLKHGGGGPGWTFSDMAIATSFNDFVNGAGAETNGAKSAFGNSEAWLTFRSWQREEGLPQNSVHALVTTPDGYLWLGGDDGVTRFDGVRFVTFGAREGLRNGRVRVLFAHSSGALWIGTAGGGLTRWHNGKAETFTKQNGLPSDVITALAEDSEARIWVGTEAGLAIESGGRFTTPPNAARFDGKPIDMLYKDRHGFMWIGAGGVGVFRHVEGKLVSFTDPTVETLLQETHCMLEDKAGQLWFGCGDDFVLYRGVENWRRYRIPRHLARPYVTALAETPDGTVWAGSVSEGLVQFKAGKLTQVNGAGGLSDNFVEALVSDREGNLWVGTGAGLNRLTRGVLTVLGQNDGLGYGPVFGLAEVAPDVILACKPGDGLYRSTGRNFSRLTPVALTGRQAEVKSILAASDGTFWVAGERGLLHFTNSPVEAEAAWETALEGVSATALAEDAAGEIWAGTRIGEVWRSRAGEWVRQTNCTQNRVITSLVPEGQDAVWIGTDGDGLFRVAGPNREHFNKQTGLPSDSIQTLRRDAQGDLWIGTAGGGLVLLHDRRLTTFAMNEGLPDNTVSQILEDESDRLWLATHRGIAAVSKRELQEVAAGKSTVVYPQVFDRMAGMSAEECTSGFFPAGLRTKSGLLWFSTLKGIAVVDPRAPEKDSPRVPVLVEEVLVDGLPVAERNGAKHAPLSDAVIRIPPGKRRLEFVYAGISFNAPERVRFRYQMEGLDSDWVDAGTRRAAFYSFLPPGKYRFRVAARNRAGDWNEASEALNLVVLRRFWQTWWFLGFVIVGLVGGVGAGVRVVEQRKSQQRLKRLEQERTLERERARIAQDLHDDLGSSLTRISLLSDLIRADGRDVGAVAIHADKISQSAAETVQALEEIVWAIRPGSDTLQSLVEYIAHFANELFDGSAAHCRLDLPHDLPAHSLPPEMRHNVFLIVKEALTNALKHAGAREVQVKASATERWLEIQVQDDGRGFDTPSQVQAETHHGLGNMRRRADAMGAAFKVTSAREKGTTVNLKISFPVTLMHGKT